MNPSWQSAIASHWLPEVWARSVEEVLRSFDVSGSVAPLQASADTPDRARWGAWTKPVWYRQKCDAADRAALRVGASQETVSAIWNLVSGQEPEPDADFTTALETYRELLNQAVTSVAAELSDKLGRPVNIGAAEETGTADAGMPALEIRLEDSGGTTLIFALALNQELAALLFDPSSPARHQDEEPAAGAPGSQAVVRQGVSDDSLRLLKKVELDLAVSFGQTTMTLEQAMKLSSGSIVELNRSVSEPVELLVNESVIARGEVVVVDGNYGVRITEIARPSDLMQDFL